MASSRKDPPLDYVNQETLAEMIGIHIKELKEGSNWSHEDLSRKFGLKPSFWKSLEEGKKTVSKATIEFLRDHHIVDMESLGDILKTAQVAYLSDLISICQEDLPENELTT